MKVRYREQALKDIDVIYEWRSRFSVEAAERTEAALFSATEWLGEFPEVGAITDEAHVRRWPMPNLPYTIFYVVGSRAIDIIRIMDARRVRNLRRVPE